MKENDKNVEVIDDKDLNNESGIQEPQVDKEADETDEIAVLQNEISELKDAHLRLMAEYDNFRKRTFKEKAELLKSGGERVLTAFLEVMDDLDLAIGNLNETTDLAGMKQGVELIYGKFVATMRSQGVTELPTVGEEFDPDRYEAVAMIPVEDASQKGKIVDCIKKGYLLNDKVIRHPKVVVGN